jgi:hypothetical protein
MLDRNEFLNQTFLALSTNRTIEWLSIEDVVPKPGHRVLLWGRDGNQEVGTFDHKVGMWVVRGEPTPVDNFTHWKMLGAGPKE